MILTSPSATSTLLGERAEAISAIPPSGPRSRRRAASGNVRSFAGVACLALPGSDRTGVVAIAARLACADGHGAAALGARAAAGQYGWAADDLGRRAFWIAGSQSQALSRHLDAAAAKAEANGRRAISGTVWLISQQGNRPWLIWSVASSIVPQIMPPDRLSPSRSTARDGRDSPPCE
jgi:hypothetical protein